MSGSAEHPIGRLEDPRLLTGKGRYTDDVSVPGEAFIGLVRSPFAHARIVSIDTSEVQKSPDFVAALTGEDLVKSGVQPVTQNPWPAQRRANRYQLAFERVRFMGEPVVALLVRRRSAVEDLLEQVRVEYDPLPVVETIEQSRQGQTLIYDDWKDNVSQTAEMKKGDFEAAISSAVHVLSAREGIARQAAVAMEPRSVLVQYDATADEYDILATTQSVHTMQGHLANELGVPREKLHVRVMDMGGGFGSKGGPSYPEPLLACLFAKRTGLPVKWTATRSEEFLETSTGRDEYCDVTIGCDASGRVVALKARIDCDVGVTGTQVHMPQMSMQIMRGPYEIENLDLKVVAYATNKLPIGPLRGAGVPEGCYFIERAMGMLAKKAGIDPLEFRRRNLPAGKKQQQEEGEGRGAGDGGSGGGREDYRSLLDLLERSARYDDLKRWRESVNSRFREGVSHTVAGLGISLRGGDESEGGERQAGAQRSGSWSGAAATGTVTGRWSGGPASDEHGQPQGQAGQTGAGGTSPPGPATSSPSSQHSQSGPPPTSSSSSSSPAWGAGDRRPWGGGGATASGGPPRLGFTTETARVTLGADGRVTVYTGSSPHGQGEETTFAQLAAEELSVPLQDVKVVWGDTVLIPQGIGTFGSRSAAIGGSAVVEATRKLKSSILEGAAKALGRDPATLRIDRGRVVVAAATTKGGGGEDGQSEPVRLGTLVEKMGVKQISAEAAYTLNGMSYSSGAHLCAVTIDTELGKVRVEKYFVAEDCGRIINKSIVEGQLHGGIIHAVGGSLFERVAHDADGNLVSSTMMDYNIPSAMDSPDIRVFHKVTPSASALNGVKGVGESGTIAAYAAVMNAINDALSYAREGAEVNIAPATPDVVFHALQGERK